MEDPLEHVVVDHAMDLLMVFDLHYNCLYANRAAQRVLGMPAEALVGMNLLDLMGDEDAADIQQTRGRALEAPFSGALTRARFPHGDGSTVPVELSIRLAPATEDRRPMFVVVARPARNTPGRIPKQRAAPHIPLS